MMGAAVSLFLLSELLVVSWLDLRMRTISNFWPFINGLIFVFLVALLPEEYPWGWEIFRIPLLFFGVGYSLYLAGMMGAGDVKYLTSYFLLVPPAFRESAFVCLLYTTMGVGLVLLVLRGFKNVDKIILSTLFREGRFFKGDLGRKGRLQSHHFGFICMVGNKKFVGNRRGQSTVEYVLLLAVIVTLASVVFKSHLFQEFFGKDADFVATLINRMEYSYRHGRMGENDQWNYQNHPTFYNKDENQSRFFSPFERLSRKVNLMIDKKKEAGQSTIEFLLTFIFVLAFIFSTLKLSFIYTNGYLVHYATFMASRAYLVVDINSNQPEGSDGAAWRRASEVFKRFPLDKFIGGYDQNLQVNHPDSGGQGFDRNLYVGVFTDFSHTFGLSPVVGGRKEVRFRSESFLGREPTRAECLERICMALRLVGGNCENHSTIFDNGC